MRVPLRFSVLAAGVSAVVLATSASAAPGPNTLAFTDPAGDVVMPLPGAGYDIAGVKFTTTGETTKQKVRGRTVTTYKPKALVVSLTMATAPNTTAGSTYHVDAELGGCGYFQMSYTPGATLGEGSVFTECGTTPDETGSTATLYDIPPSVSGNVITWTISLKGLSAEFKAGAVFSDIVAFSTFNEPVFGIIGPTFLSDEAAHDRATSDKTYVIG